MDESGCLGFDFSKPKTSRYFIVTFLFARKKRPLERIVKKVFRGMAPNIRRGHCGVLHCRDEMPRTRMKLLSLLSEQDINIMAIRLNKTKVYANLQDEKPVLYNYVTNILLDRIFTRKLVPLDDTIHLIASRRETNKFLNQNFQNYLQRQAALNHSLTELQIRIVPPHEEKGLQVVDFASWAIFRHYEHWDSSYYDVIRKRVVEDKPLFG